MYALLITKKHLTMLDMHSCSKTWQKHDWIQKIYVYYRSCIENSQQLSGLKEILAEVLRC